MLTNRRQAGALALGMLGVAVLIGALLAVPATAGAVSAVDRAVYRSLGPHRIGALVAVAKAFSVMGGTVVNWPLRALAALVLVRRRQWVQLTAFTLAVVTSEALIGTLKAAYDRPRPPGALIATSGGAFPSGHAIASAVTAVGVVLVLLPPGRRRYAWEAGAIAVSFIAALCRVYLNAHWLSDVVAGALLGGGLALGWPALIETVRHRVATKREAAAPDGADASAHPNCPREPSPRRASRSNS